MRTLSRSFQSVTQKTAKKFLRFEHPSAKKVFRFYHAAAKNFLRFPGLKLKRPAISRKKNFLQTQKEVLARALFLGCTVPANMDSVEVEILIRLNCPGAMRLRDVICGNENDPYTDRSLLG